MKLFASLPALLGLLVASSLSSPALAQQDAKRSEPLAQGRNAEKMPQAAPRRDEQTASGGSSGRQMPGVESPDTPTSERKASPGKGPGQGRERLSPEERRQLRKDINAAGRDIYRRNGP